MKSIKILYEILIIILLLSFCRNQLSTGFRSLQKPQGFENPILPNMGTSHYDKSDVNEYEEEDYVVYEITTPTMSSLYQIDDFQIVFTEKSISLKAKVS